MPRPGGSLGRKIRYYWWAWVSCPLFYRPLSAWHPWFGIVGVNATARLYPHRGWSEPEVLRLIERKWRWVPRRELPHFLRTLAEDLGTVADALDRT